MPLGGSSRSATLAQASRPPIGWASKEVSQSAEEREGRDDQGAEREVRAGQDAIVAEFSKVDVETVTKLRKKFREGGSSTRSSRTRWPSARRRARPWRSSADDFTGPVALCHRLRRRGGPGEDPHRVHQGPGDDQGPRARSSRARSRREGVKALAKLPGLPELRAQLLGMLNQPAGKLVRTHRGPGFAAGAGPPGPRGQVGKAK